MREALEHCLNWLPEDCAAAIEARDVLATYGVPEAHAPDRAAPMVPSATTTIRMGDAVRVCSVNDAACAEVPASRRCPGCTPGVNGGQG